MGYLNRDRHLNYFLTFAEEARPALEGPDIARWLDRITADQLNFRLAVEWAVKSEARVQKGLRMAGVLTRYVEVRGNLEEARDMFEELLAAPGAGEPTPARADALIGAGRIAWCRDRSEEAMKYYREAVALLEKLGLRRDYILQSAFMGFVERNLGIREHAEARFKRALEAGREFNDVMLTALGLSGLGSIANANGDFATARRLREESLAIYRSTGNRWGSGYLLWGIARACLRAGARHALEEWTGIARQLGNRWITPYLLQLYAEVLLIEGNADGAARMLGAREAGCESFGVSFDIIDLTASEAALANLNETLDAPTRWREWNEGRKLGVWEAIQTARQSTSGDAVVLGTKFVGALKAKVKETLGFSPRRLEWLRA
jgi:tetratricopeptide (TPR) repeat protein